MWRWGDKKEHVRGERRENVGEGGEEKRECGRGGRREPKVCKIVFTKKNFPGKKQSLHTFSQKCVKIFFLATNILSLASHVLSTRAVFWVS